MSEYGFLIGADKSAVIIKVESGGISITTTVDPDTAGRLSQLIMSAAKLAKGYTVCPSH